MCCTTRHLVRCFLPASIGGNERDVSWRGYAWRHTPRFAPGYRDAIRRAFLYWARTRSPERSGERSPERSGEWDWGREGIKNPHKINVGSPPPPPPPEDSPSGAPLPGRCFLQSAQRCLYVPRTETPGGSHAKRLCPRYVLSPLTSPHRDIWQSQKKVPIF